MRSVAGVAAAAALVAGAAAAAPEPATTTSRAAAKPPSVRVDMTDFKFRLSRSAVPVGSVTFAVVNRGRAPHDFVIAGRRTRVLGAGRKQTIRVRFARAGAFTFVCSVPGHARAGMRGVLRVGKAKPVAPPKPAIVDQTDKLKLTKVSPVVATSIATAPGEPGRLFVTEQGGLVKVLAEGAEPRVFLDLSTKVKNEAEMGLLGLAFAPDYAASRRFYVYYTDVAGNIRLVEYRRHALNRYLADPDSQRELLHLVKFAPHHHAGMLLFGPDGYLYVAIGDGGDTAAILPGALSQRRDELFGNILRIVPTEQPSGAPYGVPASNPFVGVPGVRPEIWAYGLRNPWRFWIDADTGDMLIGDVGHGKVEEIDRIPGGTSGQNFGWACKEGTRPFTETRDPNVVCEGELVDPVHEYGHSKQDGLCSVTGGLIVRDPRLPSLQGHYLFADFCEGKLRALALENGVKVAEGPIGLGVPTPRTFATDEQRRVYVSSGEGIFRLDPR